MTLTAPARWGSLIVGLSGAALLALILSGVLSHPRIFRDAFRLRLDGSPRLREAELHNRLSVWGLPFHLVVSLTGAVFGLSSLLVLPVATLGFHGDTARVYAPVIGPQVPADGRPMALPDLEALSTRARAVIPGARLYYLGIERPGTRGARITVEVTAPGRLPRGEDVYYDAQDREVGRGRSVTGPVGLQAYSAAAQLHFGFFGGLPVRLAYVVLGAALTFVSASGVTIWLARRQDRGRPAPRLRAAWMAWTFGAPLALLLAALASPVAPVPWVFWSAAAAAQAIGQARAGR
ncbi:PepSY domain-containing protein, partial [Phenylobacterium sp.]|uniref:PepSY-associated TM helix domain-containing protein n=1 Tax=Phenylobacterium sp. TaxID=1871053 RepID=UPI001208A80A